MRKRMMMAAIVLAALVAGAQAAERFVEEFGEGAAKHWTVMTGEWSFVDGAAVQTSSDFDCGMSTDVWCEEPFHVSVRFEPTSGFNGGGVFFALPTRDQKHGGVMVRCDPGGRVLYGHFDDAGTFEYMGDAKIDDLSGEQELAVAVDPAKSGFNIFFNGQKVATGLRTYHTKGFVGVQTSGGAHKVTRFEVRPARAGELDGIEPPGEYSGILSMVGTDERVVALRRQPVFLVAYDGEGGEIAQGPAAAELPVLEGSEARPVALCGDHPDTWTRSRHYYALLNDGHTIYKFDDDLQPVGDGPVVHDEQMQGRGIAVDADGRIFVTDAGLPGVRVYGGDGELITKFGRAPNQGEAGVDFARPHDKAAGLFKRPVGIAVRPDGLIAITDPEQYTYVCYRYDAAAQTLEWETNGPWLPQVTQIGFDRHGRLMLAGTYEFYRAFGALRLMELSGRAINVYRGYALNDMSDKLCACEGPEGRYFVADANKDRVVVLPPDFVEEMPAFAWTDDGGLKVTMTAADGGKVSAVGHTPDPDDPQRIMVKLDEAPCELWPAPRGDDLRTYSLPKKPADGKMYVIDMPVLVAVFTRGQPKDGELLEIDPNGIGERMARELEVDRRFYYLNSHATLNKQFEIMVIDEVIAPIDGPWINPSDGRRVVNEVRARRGLAPIDQHHSLVCIHPMPGYDPDITEDMGYVGGGGLTPYAYSGYALWNAGQGWLMGHEWGHQLDSYFEASGVTDWWLNHPDGTVHVGRYGEHWDCNAFLCRRGDKMNWLRFKFGTLRQTADADGDGVADRDPALPMCETRFGSDPTKVDTDGDGLDDLEELTASTFTSSDPTSQDTDGDGEPDGRDAYPCFAVAESIVAVSRPEDGFAPAEALTLVRELDSDWARADVYAGYDSDNMYFAVKLHKPAETVALPMDFDNDGWFIGRDQVYAQVHLRWTDGKPEMRNAAECEARLVDGDVPELQVRISRMSARGPLTPGSSVGTNVHLRNPHGKIKFLIDPWQVLGLELVSVQR